MNQNTLKLIQGQVRKFSYSTFLNASKSHYDSLGISKNATQTDIKSAYYKLSKIYHPDKNQGLGKLESEQKFKDITEAYEVLGNVKNRKLYDKGFTTNYHTTTTQDPLHKFYKSRETRTRPPPPSGKTPIYDFDEWAKMHYGETFRRKQEMKARQVFYARLVEDDKARKIEEVIMLVFVMFLLISAAVRNASNADKTLNEIKSEAQMAQQKIN